MKVAFRDTDEFKRGHTAELLVAKAVMANGWHVIPSYDYSGDDKKAPKMHGQFRDLVLPDLDVSRRGVRRWLEVKAKAKPSFTYITNRLEHGINLRLYRDYLLVQEVSGTPVWIAIYEESDKKLLVRSLEELGQPRLYQGDKMGWSGMAFWPRDSFRVWNVNLSSNPAHAD